MLQHQFQLALATDFQCIFAMFLFHFQLYHAFKYGSLKAFDISICSVRVQFYELKIKVHLYHKRTSFQT